MPVIFKEQHYNQLLIFMKNFTIGLIVLLILTSCYNFYAAKNLKSLKISLDKLIKEEMKYQTLTHNQKNKKEQIIEAQISELLIRLAGSAEKIKFNSIHYKNDMVNLIAVSKQQEQIFKLIEKLKRTKIFKEVRLLNVNQKDNILFELEIMRIK